MAFLFANRVLNIDFCRERSRLGGNISRVSRGDALMLNKKFMFSVVGYFVVTMAVAYPWHMVLFHDKYMAMGAFTRGEPIMPFGILAIILQGIVFAYFYPLFYRHKNGGNPVFRGIQFGLFMGLTVWTVMVFATAAKFVIEPVFDFVLYGTVFQIIQFTLVGMTIGLINGRSL